MKNLLHDKRLDYKVYKTALIFKRKQPEKRANTVTQYSRLQYYIMPSPCPSMWTLSCSEDKLILNIRRMIIPITSSAFLSSDQSWETAVPSLFQANWVSFSAARSCELAYFILRYIFQSSGIAYSAISIEQLSGVGAVVREGDLCIQWIKTRSCVFIVNLNAG